MIRARILGAAVLKLPGIFAQDGSTTVPTLHLVSSFAVAFAVGYLALGLLLWLAKGRKLSWFAPYCWIAGILAIAYH